MNMGQLETGNNPAGAQSSATGATLSGGLAADSKTEGWTWHHGGRKWHYYRDHRAICGKQMLLVHPSEGYELGNDNSSDNCPACQKRLAKAANAEITGSALLRLPLD